MAERAPTIIDVAQAAGVSTATVSRVINGAGIVKKGTRDVVEKAISSLGHRRNSLARGLVTGKTGVVGVLIPDLLGPLYGQMARGIEDVLIPLGMHSMIVSDNRDPTEERAAAELLLERRVDALIVIGSQLSDLELNQLSGRSVPIILVQREKAQTSSVYDTLQLDNENGVSEAIAYFLQMGHRVIAHLAGPRFDGQERSRIFRQTLTMHNLTSEFVFETNGTEEGGFRAAHEVCANRNITAVFCTNDRVALGFYRSLQIQSRRVPEDVSVIGFDDLPWTPYLNPPLTTLRQPARIMGQAAAERALQRLQEAEVQHLETFPAQLVKRASVQAISS